MPNLPAMLVQPVAARKNTHAATNERFVAA
jgi:hypothetical protein